MPPDKKYIIRCKVVQEIFERGFQVIRPFCKQFEGPFAWYCYHLFFQRVGYPAFFCGMVNRPGVSAAGIEYYGRNSHSQQPEPSRNLHNQKQDTAMNFMKYTKFSIKGITLFIPGPNQEYAAYRFCRIYKQGSARIARI